MSAQTFFSSSIAASQIDLTFQVAGHDSLLQIAVRELTVSDVRRWLAEASASLDRDPLHALALPDIGLDDLARMTSASTGILESLTIRQLQMVADTARDLNPHFFRVREAIDQAARAVQAETRRLVGASIGSPDSTENLPD